MNDGARNALDAYLDKIVAEARAAERKDIAEQVRRNCTPPWEAVISGSDAVVAAVAEWIANPPEWVTGSG
ncbi:hypothetical protein NS183_07840 [Microbacterium testaceum]|uniref:hypothetical protein n=1 Tax=Microbacterium testaceum TaxID=2033 RepID=UPI00073404A9|nr:hypothetical protein [Microbacterium testaceum]KTS90685.1 hypothetical protein NS183_07840 [Microbacterium testaceum]